MPAKKGSLVRLLKGDGASPEGFTVLSGGRNVNWTAGGQGIDVTTSDDVDPNGVTWRTKIPGIAEFTASLDGIIKDALAFADLVDDALTGAQSNYRLDIAGFGTFEGPMIVTNLGGSGDFDGAATYQINVEAAAALTFTPAGS